MRAARLPMIAPGLSGSGLILAINDRLRRIDALTAVTTSSSGCELVLSVPGTLGISSSAAPLVSLPTDAQPSAIVALVKQASSGGAIAAQVMAGSAVVGAVTIAEGQTSGTIGAGLGKIPANAVIALAVTSVGLAFPGADLTVMVRF